MKVINVYGSRSSDIVLYLTCVLRTMERKCLIAETRQIPEMREYIPQLKDFDYKTDIYDYAGTDFIQSDYRGFDGYDYCFRLRDYNQPDNCRSGTDTDNETDIFIVGEYVNQLMRICEFIDEYPPKAGSLLIVRDFVNAKNGRLKKLIRAFGYDYRFTLPYFATDRKCELDFMIRPAAGLRRVSSEFRNMLFEVTGLLESEKTDRELMLAFRRSRGRKKLYSPVGKMHASHVNENEKGAAICR